MEQTATLFPYTLGNPPEEALYLMQTFAAVVNKRLIVQVQC